MEKVVSGRKFLQERFTIQAEEQRKSDQLKAQQMKDEKTMDADLIVIKGEEERKTESLKHQNNLQILFFEQEHERNLQLISNTQNNGSTQEKTNQ